MTPTPEIFSSSIVAVGDFNPAIFSPDWLEQNKLIGEADAEFARERVPDRSLFVSHQVTKFESEWFVLQVLEKRFLLISKGVLSLSFKDLAAGIFQLLPHIPINAVGLNFVGHFKLENQDDYHKIGDILAPKDIWKTLYPSDFPGLEQITVRFQKGPRDNPVPTKDEKRITVQPSLKLKYGIILSLNDHRDVSIRDDDGLTAAERVRSIVDTQWEHVWHDAERVFNNLLSQALAQ